MNDGLFLFRVAGEKYFEQIIHVPKLSPIATSAWDHQSKRVRNANAES
jgi:hypothetical protein